MDKYWLLLLQTVGGVIGDWIGVGRTGQPVVTQAVSTLQDMLLARPEGIPSDPMTWKACFYDVRLHAVLVSLRNCFHTSPSNTLLCRFSFLWPTHSAQLVGRHLQRLLCVCWVVLALTCAGVLALFPAGAGALGADLQAASTRLLTLSFLHSSSCLAGMPDFHLLWLKLVRGPVAATRQRVAGCDLLPPQIGAVAKDLRAAGSAAKAASTAGSRGTTVAAARFETTVEAVKNMLLVVTAEGLVDDACRRTGQDVWALTWTIIDSVCPAVRPALQVVCPTAGGQPTAADRDTGKPGGAAGAGDVRSGDAGAGVAAPTDRTGRSPTLAELERQLQA